MTTSLSARRPWPRRLAAAVTTLVAAGTLATATPAAAATDTTPAQAGFVSGINASRTHAGRARLGVATDLTTVARTWARTMAAGNTLRHNPGLARQVRGWRVVGENVGVGSDVAGLHRAFMASPGHRANILSASYRQVGVGVAFGHGRMWVAEVFRLPSSTAATARVYSVGSRGTVVRAIQRRVGVTPDGRFGPRTRAAVVRWQRRHHLRATGVVTASTLRAMRL